MGNPFLLGKQTYRLLDNISTQKAERPPNDDVNDVNQGSTLGKTNGIYCREAG